MTNHQLQNNNIFLTTKRNNNKISQVFYLCLQTILIKMDMNKHSKNFNLIMIHNFCLINTILIQIINRVFISIKVRINN